MWKARNAILFAALAAALGSCIEMEQTITLEADGSGTHRVVLWMNRSVEDAVQNFATVAQPTGRAFDPLQAMDEERVRAELRGTGLELIKHEALRDDWRRGFEIEIAFDNLEELRKSPLLGSRAEWEFLPGQEAGTRWIVLYPQGKEAWKQAYDKAKQMAETTDLALKASADKWFAEQKKAMGEMSVEIALHLPSRVVDATRNVDVIEGAKGIAFSFSPDQVKTPEILARYLAPRFIAIVEDRGLTWVNDR